MKCASFDRIYYTYVNHVLKFVINILDDRIYDVIHYAITLLEI